MNDRGEGRSAFTLPAEQLRDDGKPRRVGFELEFSGLTLEEAAGAVAAGLDGKQHRDSSAEHTVNAPGLGDFTVEVDWSFLKKQARAAAENDDRSTEHDWTATASELATLIVPVEVVCPPLAITALDRL